MRKHGKVDLNHGEIVDALRQTGWLVASLAPLGSGIPDLLAWHPRKQWLRLIEIKTRRGKLTPDQQQFVGKWPVCVVRSVDEAINLGRF